ncbi:MAG: DUF2147 domain-containing protein [Alistipes sp.]|nr:DUF2147 domain-containing protein [Alistipes sp.]
MKKFIIAIISIMAFAAPSFAQGINDKADNIIGEYLTDRGGSKSKVRITKNADGTYDAQVFWVQNPYEADGKTKRKDVKNPDKALRNVDVDKIVIVKGLKYDKEEKCWGGAKIYDPTKGLKVNAEAQFETADKLRLRGTILGMGVTLYWTRIKNEK